MKQPELVPPDSRWDLLVGDFSDLQTAADGWPVSAAVPDGVASALGVARSLFVHSYFVYEFGLAAVTWALLILEASLRDCLAANDRAAFRNLINEAQAQSLLTPDEAEAIDQARALRNKIVHGYLLVTNLSPGAVGGMLASVHAAISDLYERMANST